ncbi:50S ribosomal protein L25 [bacterium]|nr:50S ribosomal protein L25 [bacterium]MCI0566246.1 50S ribosomal protein L25 [bacterium]MCI0680434.1 50S ribosomal protein L25 [bacterium]
MLTLKAEKRDKTSKAAYIRKQGKIPAVFYGGKKAAGMVSVPARDFEKVLKKAGETEVISLDAGDGNIEVLIHDIARDPVTGLPLHVDFYAIDKDKEVEVAVPLAYEGVSPAVKDFGGTLVKVLHELEIRVLPRNIPHEIKVDVSGLASLESHIAVKDLALPEGVTPLALLEDIVVLVAERKEEKEEPEFDAAAIEVAKKGKKEEEEALAE